MSNKNKIAFLVIVVVLVIILTRPAKANDTGTTTADGRTTGGGGSGGGSSSSTATDTTPATGFTITGVGQVVTGKTPTQTVTAPARVINISANPQGVYNAVATLKTANGTVLHVENIPNMDLTSTGYPAVYFNPTNPVWGITNAGTYTMQIEITIAGTPYVRNTDIIVTEQDLGQVSGGTSGIVIEDYSINNGSQVVLSLSGGTVGQSTTIQLKQGTNVVGSLTAPYADNMTVQSSAYGYLDVLADNTDLGGVYVPNQITGNWIVQKAKAVDETWMLNPQFAKVGSQFILTDLVANDGWQNVEYWLNGTLLGSSIPQNYAVEPNLVHHITKKRWRNFNWLGQDNDGKDRQLSQITFKIVPQ